MRQRRDRRPACRLARCKTSARAQAVRRSDVPPVSGATKAASGVSEKYGVPTIAATASSEEVYNQGYKYLFGTFTPNPTLTEPLSDIVKAKVPQVKKVAILARNDLFPLAIAQCMDASAKKRGFNVVFFEKYAIGTMDHAFNIFRGESIPLQAILDYNPRYRTRNAWKRWLWTQFMLSNLRRNFYAFSPMYNLPAARLAKGYTGIPIISVGGFRRGSQIVALERRSGREAFWDLNRR